MNGVASARLWLAALAVGAGSLAACDRSEGPSGPSNPSTARGIVVLGDSLAVTPSLEVSFPAVLAARLAQEGFEWTLTNASVSGDTTADGRQRLDAALGADTRVLVLELGANDGLRGEDTSTIEANLAAIIDTATQRGIDVLLCGMETPPLHGFSYSFRFHNIFPGLAQRYDLRIVPFLLDGVALNPDYLGGDGVHPNVAGARRIADTVWPHLRSLLVAIERASG